jgi:ribose-phosphate pyrophosphokinase
VDAGPLRVFVLDGAPALGLRLCRELGVAADAHEESVHADGECSARPLCDVDGCDVFVLPSLHADPLASVHDKLCRLLFFVGTLKDAGAARVTAVLPYLPYARQDRQTSARGPVATRYVATLIEAAGADAVVTVDVHNVAAFQNAFRRRTIHLEAAALFAGHVAAWEQGDVVVVAPDAGGIGRAGHFRQLLAVALGRPVAAAFAEKHRDGRVLSGTLLAGDVAGRHAIIIDDIIDSGATVARAAAACRRMGALTVSAVATHGLFTAGAALALGGLVDRLVVSDTVPPFRLEQGPLRAMLQVVGVAPLLADAIRALHGGACAQG